MTNFNLEEKIVNEFDSYFKNESKIKKIVRLFEGYGTNSLKFLSDSLLLHNCIILRSKVNTIGQFFIEVMPAHV